MDMVHSPLTDTIRGPVNTEYKVDGSSTTTVPWKAIDKESGEILGTGVDTLDY